MKRWAMDVAKRRGAKRAKVTRKLDGTSFRWTKEKMIGAAA